MANHIDRKQFVLQLVILAILLVLIGGGAWGAWKALTRLSPQVSTAVIAGAVTVLVSVFSILWSKRIERLREIEQEQRKQKIPVYEEFLALIFRIVFAEKLQQDPVSEAEMLRAISAFAQKIIVWGSDDVLKEYATFRRLASAAGSQGTSVVHVFAIERLLLAIRRDVGHKNKNLKQGDLLSIFVNDIDSFLHPKE